MTGIDHILKKSEPISRSLSNTEHSWCRAVSCGTGITVLALQMAKSLEEISVLMHNVMYKIQSSHPVLRSKLQYDTNTKEFSLHIPTTPNSHIQELNLSSTAKLLDTLSNNGNTGISPFHLIFEHEMNNNKWSNPISFPRKGIEVLVASVYALSKTRCVIALRFHTAICDRTTAVSLLMELMEVAKEGDVQRGLKNDGEGCLGIESLVPKGLAKKTLWAHGMDMLGYSVNSLRLTNLKFKNVKWPRCSEVVRLQLNKQDTDRVLAGCKSRGIKLCGALAAAGLIAAHSSTKLIPDQQKKKYGVVTLTDCRPALEPALSIHHFGFYHSAVLNIHTLKGAENLWDLAKRSYTAFADYKKSNKHFSDMADLNFLMCKAIENPSLTASSSLRSSFISVFEDPVYDNSSKIQKELGVEDYMGSASVHGVGPSIAIFDTIRDGEMDCACVYPSPLHSREQMDELVDCMRRILIEGSNIYP